MIPERTSTLDAATVLNIVADHMIEQIDYLINRHPSVHAPMSNSEFFTYECDHMAYNYLTCELAFLKGLSNGITEIPEAKPFPSPF